VQGLVRPGEKVLVILDSNHTKAHVLAELEAYAGLVTPGSYIIVADGVMEDLTAVPGGQPGWSWDNPKRAALEFLQGHREFVLERPAPPFNEGKVTEPVTYWPSAYLKRLR